MEFPRLLRHPEGNKPIMAIAPNVTGDGRTWYGVKWSEVAFQARRWWNNSGRKEMGRTKKDLRHQDTGVDSAILRGEHWESLDRRERARVTLAYEEQQLRRKPEFAQMLLEFMIHNFPEELDQEELGKHLASSPDPDVHIDTFLEGRDT